MAKLTSNINSSLLNTSMGVLGKLMKTEKVPTLPDLENIFTKNEKVVSDIKDSMEKEGFRKEEPIVIAQLPDGTVLGVADGNTRLYVAKLIGLEEVYVTYRTFESLEEAQKYARNRQFHRRNLSQAEIFQYASNLNGVEEKTGEGRASERLAKDLGVSASTIEHARTVDKKASDELKEKIRNNELTLNKAYQSVRQPKPKNKKNEDNDISDALEDNSGNPAPIGTWDHSDGIERPSTKLSPEEDSERTKERRKAYEDGFSEGFWKALVFALSEIKKGKTPEEVYKDERVSDLSPQIITKFELPEDAEDIIGKF